MNVLLQDCFLTMGPAWYQSLIKVLLSRFPQSCRHFDDNGIQYLVRKKEFKVANPQAPVSMSFPLLWLHKRAAKRYQPTTK